MTTIAENLKCAGSVSHATSKNIGNMPPDPTICAIMLTRDRPAMAARAVESFRRQTYERKRLLVVNSGPSPILPRDSDCDEWPQESEPCFIGCDAKSIGELRNLGCKFAS